MSFFGKIAKAMNPINQVKGVIGAGKSLVKGDLKGAGKAALQAGAVGSPWEAKLRSQKGRSNQPAPRPALQARPAGAGAPPPEMSRPAAPGAFSQAPPRRMV